MSALALRYRDILVTRRFWVKVGRRPKIPECTWFLALWGIFSLICLAYKGLEPFYVLGVLLLNLIVYLFCGFVSLSPKQKVPLVFPFSSIELKKLLNSPEEFLDKLPSFNVFDFYHPYTLEVLRDSQKLHELKDKFAYLKKYRCKNLNEEVFLDAFEYAVFTNSDAVYPEHIATACLEAPHSFRVFLAAYTSVRLHSPEFVLTKPVLYALKRLFEARNRGARYIQVTGKSLSGKSTFVYYATHKYYSWRFRCRPSYYRIEDLVSLLRTKDRGDVVIHTTSLEVAKKVLKDFSKATLFFETREPVKSKTLQTISLKDPDIYDLYLLTAYFASSKQTPISYKPTRLYDMVSKVALRKKDNPIVELYRLITQNS